MQQQSAGGSISAYDLEAAKQKDTEQTLEQALLEQRGDSFNALFNHRWVSMAVIAFVMAIIFSAKPLLALAAFLLIIIFFAWQWSRNTLVMVDYRRKFHHTHVFPNETTEVEISLENRKWLPVTWLQVADTWPSAFPPTNERHMARSDGDPTVGYLTNAYSLRWYERVRRHYQLTGKLRGRYELGPTNLISGDPFSLFERMAVKEDQRQYLVVYPEVKPLEELGFPLHDPFGDRRVQRRLFEDPNRIMGVRDYQPHDNFRTIHWKASAKTGNLQTKIFEPTRGTSIVLAVNIASFDQYWRGYWPAMLEYTLTMTGSIAKWAFEQDYAVGITCNGAVSNSDQPFRLPPSRRYNQLQLILEMLAGVRYYVTTEFGRHILLESPRMPIGATFVLITPFVSEMIGSASLRLRDNGRRVNWVVLGKQPPQELPRIQLYHLPIMADEADIIVPDDMILKAKDENEVVTQETPRQRYLRLKNENPDSAILAMEREIQRHD